MYGSSGTPTQTVTAPPPGSAACSITGAVRRLTGRTVPTSDRRVILTAMTPERVVDLRTRTILRVLLIVLGVAVALEVLWIARHVLAWVVIALFLALALNPLVGWIERRGRLGRGPAIVHRVPDASRSSIAARRRDVHPEADRRGERIRPGDCRTTSTT